jgi:hypothetical protein
VHWAEPFGCIFSVVVIARHKTMERVNSKNTALVVNALNKLQKTERSCKRYCLSEKSAPYAEKDAHVTRFYVKTAHVGKNDNSRPLTEKENYFYGMTFAGTLDS